MQWYEDEAYVSWQRRDGPHAKFLERARRYAKRQSEGDEGKPRKVQNETVSAAIQLNSEYSAWISSMLVERHRCVLYAQMIAKHSLDVDEKGEADDDRLKITASIAMRIAGDLHRGKHWSNVWREIGNKGAAIEVEEEVEEEEVDEE